MSDLKGNNGIDEAQHPKSMIEDAYQKIKNLIFQQKIVPGQKLVYDDLARMLNMSRTPIIIALNRLEQHGLVVSETFRGFTVKPMDIQEAWDAFGLREALETYAVKEAIKLAEPQDFIELEKKIEAHRDYTPGYYDRKKIFLDAQVHLQIAAMTKNRILKWHIKTNLEHVYLRANLNNYKVERMSESPVEHQKLLERMKKKDIIGSVELICLHVQRARDHVIACLSNNEEINEEYAL